VASHALAIGVVAPGTDRFIVGTRDGDKPVEVTFDDGGLVATVTVDMGPPSLDPKAVPFVTNGAGPDGLHRLELDGTTVELTPVSMGNPHAVLVVDDVTTAPVTAMGPRLETHERFPQRTNVEFIQVVDDTHLRLRVWERGVGETLSCGTGACAALVALQQQGRAGARATIEVPGGTLEVTHEPGSSVFLTGPVSDVYTGTLGREWLAAVEASA
jgi:diaminopimelate epimerase